MSSTSADPRAERLNDQAIFDKTREGIRDGREARRKWRSERLLSVDMNESQPSQARLLNRERYACSAGLTRTLRSSEAD